LRLPKFPRLEGISYLDGPSGSSSRRSRENARDGDADSRISLDENFLLSDMLNEELDLEFDNFDLGYPAHAESPQYNPKINLDESHLKSEGTAGASSPFSYNDDIQPSFEEEDWGIEIDDDGNVRVRNVDSKPVGEEEVPVAQEPLASDPPLSDNQSELPALWKAEHQLEARQEAEQGAAPATQSSDALPVLSDELAGSRPQEETDIYHLPPDSSPPRRAEDVYEIELNNQSHIRGSRQAHNYEVEDEQTALSLAQLQEWEDNYTERTVHRNFEKQLRKRPPPGHTKKHARFLIFGRGLNNVGKGEAELLSPLAHVFAARNLERLVLGEPLPPIGGPTPRRRRAAEAIDSDDEYIDNRRASARKSKKARVTNDEQQQQQTNAQRSNAAVASDAMGLAEQKAEGPRGQGTVPEPELGRAAGSALPDPPSDNPWVPSSSIKAAAGGRPGSQLGTSPSLPSRGGRGGRGTHLASDIERYSDRPPFSSDPFVPFNEEADLFMADPARLIREDGYNRDFLDAVEDAAANRGTSWVDFSDLLPPALTSRAQATMAFFQILSLVTRGAMRVEQDGAEGIGPRGEIRVAVVARGGADTGFACNE